MARVKCSLVNASEKINGIAFASVPGGMLSEEISDEQAAAFTAIKGFDLVGKNGKVAAAAPVGDAASPPAAAVPGAPATVVNPATPPAA